jgi:hypothetical protein
MVHLFFLEGFAKSRDSGLRDIVTRDRVIVREGLYEMLADESTADDRDMTVMLKCWALWLEELGKTFLEIADVGLQLRRLSGLEKIDFWGGRRRNMVKAEREYGRASDSC